MSLISAPAGVQQPQRGPAWGGDIHELPSARVCSTSSAAGRYTRLGAQLPPYSG